LHRRQKSYIGDVNVSTLWANKLWECKRGMIQPTPDHLSAGSAATRTPVRRKRFVTVALTLAAIAAVLFVSLRIAAPSLVSSALVRSAIASSIAQWAGYDVSIDDVAELTFWPEPEVTLTGVKVSHTEDGVEQAVVQIERFSAQFSLLSALQGRPDFNDFRLVRPQIRIMRQADGQLAWSDHGLLSEAVRFAAQGKTASREHSRTLEAEIGSIEVIDGEVTLSDAGSGAQIVARTVNASIDWPRLAAPLTGEASLTLNDRSLAIALRTPTPLLLLGGAQSDIDVSADVPGVSGSFKGRAGLQDGLQTGDIALSVTDMAAATASLGLRPAGTERWRSASFKAQIERSDREWELEDLNFEVNGVRGDGILTLTARPAEKPLLSGTLALDHIELADLLQALSINVGDRANVRLPSLTSWVDLDVRLSATTAAFNAFQLDDLGASLLGRDETLQLVIGDTRFLGGTLSARLSGSGDGFDKGADVAIIMERVDLGSLTSGFGVEGPQLEGSGSLTFNAKLIGTGLQENVEAMSGRLEISADNGEIRGIDASGLRRLSVDRAYFQLSAAGDRSFDYKTLDVALRFSEGSAEVEKARIAGDAETLSLSGLIPYSRRALALTGELTPTAEASDAAPLRFFVGGAWSDPVISPIPPLGTAGQ
jgi:AsmA protein